MPDVRYEQKGQALWLTIDREERRNALNEAVFSTAFAPASRRLKQLPSSRRCHDRRRRKVFCAGGDLKPNAEGDPFTVDPAERDNPSVIGSAP